MQICSQKEGKSKKRKHPTKKCEQKNNFTKILSRQETDEEIEIDSNRCKLIKTNATISIF